MAEMEKKDTVIGLANVEITTSNIDGIIGELELIVTGLNSDLETGVSVTQTAEETERKIPESRLEALDVRLDSYYVRLREVTKKVNVIKDQFAKREG